MRKMKIALIVVSILAFIWGIYYEVTSPSTLVTHPKGLIAFEELKLIRENIAWMLVIILPTLIWLLVTAWKTSSSPREESDESESTLEQALLWIVPSIVIAIMSVITWNAAHRLDPRAQIPSDKKTLTIQVVAMDWKWLFIYPEQNIASLNFLQFPEKTPIEFILTADAAPMNSFWLPQMSGQIYAMTGMMNKLHIIADGPGVYTGRAVEINGDGYSDMTFKAKSCSAKDFAAWVALAKKAKPLKPETYTQLTRRSINDPVTLFSGVNKDLFDEIVMKNMEPPAKP